MHKRNTCDEVHSAGSCLCCWVCEGWVEVELSFTPCISTLTEGDIKHVCAFCSVDNFSRPVHLQKRENGWRGYRFLPPSKHPALVVFQVDDHLETALDMERRALVEPLPIKLFKGDVRNLNRRVSSLLLSRPEGQEEDEAPGPVNNVREISEVNILRVDEVAAARARSDQRNGSKERGAMQVEGEDLRSSSSTRPRQIKPLEQSVQKQRWTPAQTVWASHKNISRHEFEMAENKCFERDWRLVQQKICGPKSLFSTESTNHKGGSAFGEEGVLGKLHERMHAAYGSLRLLYQYTSTVGYEPSQVPPYVSLGAFTRMLRTSGVTQKYPRLQKTSEIDRIFITAKYVPNKMAKPLVLTGQGLVRWQFMEAVIRVALQIQGTAKVLDVLDELLEECLLPAVRDIGFDVHAMQEELISERVDSSFKMHLPKLRQIFGFFAGKHQHRPERVPPMIMSEWFEVMREAKLVDDLLTEKQLPLAFSLGKALVPEESMSVLHTELDFVEFLMALGMSFLLRVRSDGNSRMSIEVIDELLEVNIAKLTEQVEAWRGSGLFDGDHVVNKLRGFGCPPEWLMRMLDFLRQLFATGDDDGDAELSLRELRLSLQDPGRKRELLELGIEIVHLNKFFQDTDLDGSGQISMTEAFYGFAKVRDQFRNDERTIAFLRRLLEDILKALGTENGSGKHNASDDIPKALFFAHLGGPEQMAQLQCRGIFVTVEQLWERACVEAEGGAVDINSVLSAYLALRDPEVSGDKAVGFLRQLFEEADADGSGTLERQEFVSIIRNPENLAKMEAFGFSAAYEMGGMGGTQEAARANAEGLDSFESNMLLFFEEIDNDFSGRLTIDDVLSGFLRCRDMMRQRAVMDHEEVRQVQEELKTKARRRTTLRGAGF